jgi:dolichol kinase
VALTKEEINRKLLHLFALAMPAGIFYLPKFSISLTVPLGILASLLAGSILVEHLRFKFPAVQKIFFAMVGSMLREEESRKTTGSTYVIGAALLCGILFRNYLHIAFMVLFLFILGDAVAALVGISMGRIKIGKKSLEGSTACFLMCMTLQYAVFPFLPGLLDSWGGSIPFIIALSTSLAITLFELIPLKITKNLIINDNLAVPVIAGYVMLGLSKVLGLG